MNNELRQHAIVMKGLDNDLDALIKLIPSGSRVVYLDIPSHFNVGDLLINLGTEAFFARHRIFVVARFTLDDLCIFESDWLGPFRLCELVCRRISSEFPDAILVLHGGGNFGDLYPAFHRMREMFVTRFPERKIVMLPQSAHFSSEAAAAISFEIFNSHHDLHLAFRDTESVSLAVDKGFDRAILSPDMAHALWDSFEKIAEVAEAGSGFLTLRRMDIERTAWDRPGEPISSAIDWENLVTWKLDFSRRLIRKMMVKKIDRSFKVPIRLWYIVRDAIIRRAVTLFLTSEIIVTDRLHAMILGSLLSRKVRYRDNSYGKLSRYHRAFLEGSSLISRLPN